MGMTTEKGESDHTRGAPEGGQGGVEVAAS